MPRVLQPLHLGSGPVDGLVVLARAVEDPAVAPGATFHSSDSSKSRNCSRVTMSPAAATRVRAPFTTCHPDGGESILKPRHPAVVLPSNRRRQPAARSAGVSVLGDWADRAGAIAGSRVSTAVAASSAERATVIVSSGPVETPGQAPTLRPQHRIRQ